MPEFHLSEKDRKILEHEESVTNGIRSQFTTLLRDGGRITTNGKILGNEDPSTQDAQVIEPGSLGKLGYWYDWGKTNIVVGQEMFKPIDALANYAKGVLIAEGLILLKDGRINHRFKMDRFTKLMLTEISDKEGVGRIIKPQQAA